MSRILFSLAAALAALASASAARADTPPAFGDQQAPVDLSGPVTLQDCVAQALSRNFTVRINHFNIDEAIDSVTIAKAGFEPTIGFTSNRTVTQTPTNEAALGLIPYSSEDTGNVSLTEPLLTGGTVSANYTLDRYYYSPAYTEPNPAFGSSVQISVVQPLLQGAGTDYSRAAIESAKLGVRISNLNFKSTVLTMVYNIETAYFNLLFAREQYKVQQQTLKLSQQLYDENSQKRSTGILTDLDVSQARAGVASAENQLILDAQAVHNDEDALLQLLGDTRFSTAVGSVEFPFAGQPDVSFARSYKMARENGPNLAVAQATIDQYRLSALRAKRNALPEVNVNGGLGYSSYAATAGQSVTGAWNGYNWTAGLTVSIPWGLHATRALYHQAMEGVRTQQLTYDQIDQNLMVQVRSAVRAVQTSVASVNSSAEETVFAQKSYDLQKAEFDAGLATSYLVLQAEDNLETARVSELQAKVSLLTSIAQLKFLEGSSLQAYGIVLPE